MKTLASTLRDWAKKIRIIRYFSKNNGVTEEFHRKIKLIQCCVYGFINFGVDPKRMSLPSVVPECREGRKYSVIENHWEPLFAKATKGILRLSPGYSNTYLKKG